MPPDDGRADSGERPLLPGSVDAALSRAGEAPFVLVLGPGLNADSAGGRLHKHLPIRANDDCQEWLAGAGF
jgi:hypothetical protein